MMTTEERERERERLYRGMNGKHSREDFEKLHET